MLSPVVAPRMRTEPDKAINWEDFYQDTAKPAHAVCFNFFHAVGSRVMAVSSQRSTHFVDVAIAGTSAMPSK